MSIKQQFSIHLFSAGKQWTIRKNLDLSEHTFHLGTGEYILDDKLIYLDRQKRPHIYYELNHPDPLAPKAHWEISPKDLKRTKQKYALSIAGETTVPLISVITVLLVIGSLAISGAVAWKVFFPGDSGAIDGDVVPGMPGTGSSPTEAPEVAPEYPYPEPPEIVFPPGEAEDKTEVGELTAPFKFIWSILSIPLKILNQFNIMATMAVPYLTGPFKLIIEIFEAFGEIIREVII